MEGYQILVVYFVVLLSCLILYKYPKEKISAVQPLTEQCIYDTEVLCPACFPEHIKCSFFEDHIALDGFEQLHRVVHRFNQQSDRVAILDGERLVVIRNLNSDVAIETLRDSICEELGMELKSCTSEISEEFRQILRQRVQKQDLLQGATICPSGDEDAFSRFVQKFSQPDLLTLLLMKSNIRPLLLQLLLQRDLPVPTFVFQAGFMLVESYDGEPLAYFYQYPLKLRLKIVNELISAILNFNSGVDNFRFYLTDINPENIVVKILARGKLKVSFVNLNNVIIVDGLSKRLNPNRTTITRSQIVCDGCLAKVGKDVCTYSHSDINLFAVCQLLLENRKGEGILHNAEDSAKFMQLRKMLHHCVYCQSSNCEDRQEVLEKIQQVIYSILRG